MLNRREWLRRGAQLGCVAAAVNLPGCGEKQPARPAANPAEPPRIGAVNAPPLPDLQPRGLLLNDRQSRLNATSVLGVLTPRSTDELQAIVRRANEQRVPISVAGGRFAMGGQQFGQETMHVAATSLDQVLEFDSERGLLRAQSGVMWPELLAYLDNPTRPSAATSWTIRQKQAGVNRVTLAGAVSANVHGRGLRFPPIADDIESLVLVDGAGETLTCSRQENAELFALAIGGYGLFGVIAEVTLRLVPRFRVRQSVEVIETARLAEVLQQRLEQGYVFGACELSPDFSDDGRPHQGVLTCGLPLDPGDSAAATQPRRQTPEEKTQELLLRHQDPQAAFAAISQRLLAANGEVYWSAQLQMEDEFVDVHPAVDEARRAASAGSDIITEALVPHQRLADFLVAAGDRIREQQMEIVSVVVTMVEPDDVAFLRWAVERTASVRFSLHADHSNRGLDKAAQDARALIQTAVDHGGRYHPTYHRSASRDQVLAAFPQFIEFLKLKLKFDPQERFQSQWYRHYKAMFRDEVQV
jgi:FAD/FMN-containing dehydrogenase